MTDMQLKTLLSGQVRHERDRGEAVRRLSAEPAAPEAGQEPAPKRRRRRV